MANKALKGLTIKIGGDTSELLDSLKDVEKRGKSLSGELGQINKLLKLDPKNTELLAQKQKVLAEAVSNTEKKLDTLREAEKQAQEQFKKGEISEQQYRALQREIIATESKLDRYKSTAKETADAEKDLADGAEDAADEADNLGDATDDLAVGGLAALAAAAAAAVTAIVALAEESREYRNEMAKLDTAFQDNGFSVEAATKTYEELQSVLGETEQAVEAANNIAALAKNEEDLAMWTEIATGVYGKFGASLPVEGLAEAANETMRVGQVTGPLADALNWAAAEGETFGVTLKKNTSAAAGLNKTVSDTEKKLEGLKAAEKQNKTQLEAAKTAVSDVKKEISATEKELDGYWKTVRAAGGANVETAETIKALENKLAGLKEKEQQAQETLEKSQTASKENASRLKDEISETSSALSGYKKAAQEAAGPTDEWNKAVEEAASAEDYFNLALQQCSTEQERQQLITETLTKLYGSAATRFKETNKEVIRANKATEKWNKATAKIGKTVEPVVTDIKELGVALLEDAGEPLENIAKYIRKDVLPAVKGVSSWVKQNGPLIKSTVVGITAAMVALKTATIANTVAQKGLKGAILATTVAEKALQVVQAASPWGLVAVAITTATTALLAYCAAVDSTREPVDALTQEERELVEAADEAAAAFRDQKKATDDALRDVTAQMDYVAGLADELFTLADASGKVKESDQARADFILHELNEALGTEYKQVDGLIVGYKDLKKSIEDVIKSKKANLLLEAAEELYTNAVTAREDAYARATLKEKEYRAAAEELGEVQERNTKLIDQYNKKLQEGGLDDRTAYSYRSMIKKWQDEIEAAKKTSDELKKKWDEADAGYQEHVDTILTYEAASSAALAGNYETTVDLLSKKGGAYKAYSGEVDEETAKVLAALDTEAREAGEKAVWTREQFEKGVSGFTKEMVTEAETGYKKALGHFASAYSDAYGLGENFGQGLADGIKIKNGAVGAAAIAQIREAVKAAKKEAEINSPSRKTREIGEGLGEGAEVGIKNTTKDVKRAATKQASAILDAYSEQEVKGQKALRGVADQQAVRQAGAQQAASASYSPMLERILAAIEQGQVLAIDGDALVGATADKMDNALGRRRALTSRGAI